MYSRIENDWFVYIVDYNQILSNIFSLNIDQIHHITYI